VVMADVHDKITRSYNMSKVKGKNTKPEILVRKILFANGFRFRIHNKKLPGRPDIVLPKYKTAIFVNGCFWHGHSGCKYYILPKTRSDWWLRKITYTIQRDKNNREQLKKLGWRVFVVWECDLRKTARIESVLKKIKQ
jgi:DNA mismatch endonuclease (patch repair protein)